MHAKSRRFTEELLRVIDQGVLKKYLIIQNSLDGCL